MSAYEKLAGLIVGRGAVPIAGRLETAGWWLAPVQLTPEMRTAGQDAGGFDGYRQEDNTDDIWSAFLAAAPPAAALRAPAAPELGGLGDRLAELSAKATPNEWSLGPSGHENKLDVYSRGGWFLRLDPGYSYEEFPDPDSARAEFDANTLLICELVNAYRSGDLALRTTAPALPVDAGEGRVQRAIISWLLGEGPDPLDSIWIGDEPEAGKTPWWWRTKLRRLLAAAPQPPGVSPAPDALAALKELVDASFEAYGCDPDDEDDEDVCGPGIGITFGMIRRARAAIAQAETGEAGASEPSLREALERLSKQVGKLTLFESELRAELGNTAWRDLTMALSHANAALVAPSPEPSRHGVEAMDEVTKEAMLDAGYAVIQREPRLRNSGFLLGHVAQIYDAMQAVRDRAAIAQAETVKAGASESGPINDVFNAKCKLIQTFYVALDARVRSDEQRKGKAEQLFLNTVNEVLAWASKPAPSPEPSRHGVEAMRQSYGCAHDPHDQSRDDAAAEEALASVFRQKTKQPVIPGPATRSRVEEAIRAFQLDHDERGGIVLGPVTAERLAASICAALAQHQGAGQTSGGA